MILKSGILYSDSACCQPISPMESELFADGSSGGTPCFHVEIDAARNKHSANFTQDIPPGRNQVQHMNSQGGRKASAWKGQLGCICLSDTGGRRFFSQTTQ